MTAFRFASLVPALPGAYESTCFGADGTAPNRFTDKEVNKAVKLGPAENFLLCVAGNELEGIVAAMDGTTTMNNGFSFGTVQRKFNGGLEAMNTNATVLVVGDTIVCDAQAALGTAQSYPNIKKGVPTSFIWRVKSLLGNGGVQNQLVLIERVNG